MKKIVVVGWLMAGLLVCGCTSQTVSYTPPPVAPVAESDTDAETASDLITETESVTETAATGEPEWASGPTCR
jgi:hypothetical protein